MINYVLDSNIVSFAIRNTHNMRQKMTNEIANGNRLILTPITLFEVMRGLLAVNSQNRMTWLEVFWKNYGEDGIDEKVFRKAAEIYDALRKIGKPIEDADLFIAAFCLVNNYTMVTNNTKHFARVNGLKIVDWTVT